MPAKPDEQRCACGWRGERDQCPMHPRQGYLTCPRCGRIPLADPAAWQEIPAVVARAEGRETP